MNQSSRLRLRRVMPDDIRTLLGTDMDPEFCIQPPVGFAALRDGELIAAGFVTIDRWYRAWGWFTQRDAVSAVTMHRCAVEMLKILRLNDFPELYAICNLAIPGAEKWLLRLGFAEDRTLQHERGPIYRCDLQNGGKSVRLDEKFLPFSDLT